MAVNSFLKEQMRHPLASNSTTARHWQFPSAVNLLMHKSYRSGVQLVVRDLGPQHLYLYHFRRMDHTKPGDGLRFLRQLLDICEAGQIALALHPITDRLHAYYKAAGFDHNRDRVLGDVVEDKFPAKGRALFVFYPKDQGQRPWYFSPPKFVDNIYSELNLSPKR